MEQAGADGDTRWWQMTCKQVTRDLLLALPLALGELFQPPVAPCSHLGAGVPAT